MDVEIRDKPAFANLRVRLSQGDRLIAEADAMASMTTAVQMQTRLAGGFFTAILRRLLGGESMFINEFQAASGGAGAELVLTQPLPGDIECVELRGQGLFLQPGAFIACEHTVNLGLGWAGLASFIGREGLFRLRAGGRGRIWFGAYGGIQSRDIDGELIVDTGHLIAYEPTLSLRVGMPAGIFSSFFGGEGLVTRVRGRGRIYIQTRSLSALAAWTNSHL